MALVLTKVEAVDLASKFDLMDENNFMKRLVEAGLSLVIPDPDDTVH